MNILLIFGASGELGKGATKVLANGKFDRIYLFVSRTDVSLEIKSNETFIEIKDLSVEDNVKNAFDKIN
ncbi:MAG: hypothetical protein Q8903_01685, partial [Bacteroidota bacterium]|nr:hypothetical protein [Bacteroidota bacterium]